MFPSFVLTLRSVHLLPEEKAFQMIHSDVRGHDGGSLHKDYKGHDGGCPLFAENATLVRSQRKTVEIISLAL